MKNTVLNGSLKEFFNEKGNLCVSVIIPTDKISPGKQKDPIIFKKTIEKLKLLLGSKMKPKESEKILSKVEELTKDLDFVHSTEGIGIFVSSKVQRLVHFPFPVRERIVVGDSFETRDLIYTKLNGTTYYVLSLSGKLVQLYKCTADHMEEVKDKNFPGNYTDDWEYGRSGRGTSFGHTTKGVEKDKSILKEIRMQSFFHDMDKSLNPYLVNGTPLIITGVKKDLGYFEKLTKHAKNIVGTVTGNFDNDSAGKLNASVWKVMKEYIEKQKTNTLKELIEHGSMKRSAMGLKDVWKTAMEGNVLKLIVEKDFSKPAFLGKNEYKVLFRPPNERYTVLNDAVDDLIEAVLEKNGTVEFVDNGMLKDSEQIAAIKRY